MSAPAIEVSGLGKRYVIEHESRHDNLRDTLHHTARKLWRRYRWGTSFEKEEFWALRDVSFSVQPGEVIGIIGRNGAGKSTLLKILSRITEPTTGSIRLRGRVASLLEVGTGFHPDLTGRENIFLNGAILGMSRAEIRAKFDEIVAFAEVERFLDTPVKRYSSGMYVRLAFAVAAHLEPEILIVDEVLAVGDIAFQKKCLGKMQNVARSEGRTVLFVSHHMAAIRQLCRTALSLGGGQVVAHGPTAQVLESYLAGSAQGGACTVPKPSPELLAKAYVTALRLEDLNGTAVESVPVGQPWRARVRFRIIGPQRRVRVALGLRTLEGIGVQTAWVRAADYEAGDFEAVFTQDRVTLEAGSYTCMVGLDVEDRSLQQFDAARLQLTGEGANVSAPSVSGVGLVLDSMATAVRPL